MQGKSKPGNAGYAGYEYQIEVTIWAALDLMVAKHATDEVTIEPPCDEDFEAAVDDPSPLCLRLQLRETNSISSYRRGARAHVPLPKWGSG